MWVSHVRTGDQTSGKVVAEVLLVEGERQGQCTGPVRGRRGSRGAPHLESLGTVR